MVPGINDGITLKDYKKWKETMGEEAEYAIWRTIMIINRQQHEAIALRDQFAIAALNGLASAHAINYEENQFIYPDAKPLAEKAYEIADAMLEARNG